MLVVVGTAITVNVGGAGGAPGVAAYAFGALFSALMLVRRHWPVATLLITAGGLIVYYMLSYPPIGLAPPVAAALYSAADLGKLRVAIGTAGALLAISIVFRIAEGDDLRYVLGFELAGSAALMATVIALGDSMRSRRGWRAELARQKHTAALEREREAARRVENERLRIARDLHDLLAHTASVISLHTDVAREALHDDPATAEQSLQAARAASGEITRELRATLRALRSGDESDDEPVYGLDRLDTLLDTVRAAGLEIQLDVTGEPVRLTSIADATAYRLVQESLSNVLRHARARSVVIELGYGAEAVSLRVSDDGLGAEQEHPQSECGSGWGILGMRERLTLLGGELRTSSRPGDGFVVEATIPWKDPA